VGLIDGDGGERPVRLLDHEIPSSEFRVSSAVPPCLADAQESSASSWCDPGHGTRASTYVANYAWCRERTYTRTFSSSCCTVAQYRNSLLLEPVGELQLLIVGVIQLVMYAVLGVLQQGEEGCCCHLLYLTCLDSKHSINIH